MKRLGQDATTASQPDDWIPLEAALSYIDRNSITDGLDPRRELVVVARSGFPVFGRRFPGAKRELVPEPDWHHCQVDVSFDHRRLPGIHFDPEKSPPWCELEVRRTDLEERWPARSRLWVKVYPNPPPTKRPRGPQPGSVDRFGSRDRKLFDELEQLMLDQSLSVTAAATRLAESGRIAGTGTSLSRAKRLAGRYLRERRDQAKLAETR